MKPFAVIYGVEGEERGKSEIRSRKVVEAYQTFIVYTLSKLRELGLLNFGLMKIASEAAGRALAKQLADGGVKPSSIEEAIELLKNEMDFFSDASVRVEDELLEVRIREESCRICPKKAEGVTLRGYLCPLAGLVKGLLEGLNLAKLEDYASGSFAALAPVTTQDGYCVLKFKLTSKRAS